MQYQQPPEGEENKDADLVPVNIQPKKLIMEMTVTRADGTQEHIAIDDVKMTEGWLEKIKKLLGL